MQSNVLYNLIAHEVVLNESEYDQRLLSPEARVVQSLWVLEPITCPENQLAAASMIVLVQKLHVPIVLGILIVPQL